MITSLQNESVKEYKLLCKKGKEGLIPLEGTRLICDAILSGVSFEDFFITEELLSSQSGREIKELLIEKGIEYVLISNKVAEGISLTKTSQGVFASAKWKPEDEGYLMSSEVRTIVALDGVSDPGNVGTLIRTSAAMGVDVVLFGGESAKGTNPKAIRASMGTIFKVPCVESSNLAETLKRLKNEGFQIISADASGTPVDVLKCDVPFVLVIGGEAFGITESIREITSDFVSIPMKEKVESLNASVAGGILIYDIMRRFG